MSTEYVSISKSIQLRPSVSGVIATPRNVLVSGLFPSATGVGLHA